MLPILIIDDDPVIQLVLKKTLQEQGYEVMVARSGEEGIVQAQRFRPALIICDWLMSGIDGLEVCRQVKADATLASTFFILLTARTRVVDRIEGLDAGADEFLPKPIEINELKARVRAGLRLYQAAQDLQRLAEDLRTQKQRLETELAEAAEYVRSILPAPLTDSVAIDSLFLPSRQLGGDCFDYYWLDADSIAIYLLDVSGHGLGAALPSVSVQNLLRWSTTGHHSSQPLPTGTNLYQPDTVLKALNAIFQMSQQNQRYFTIWYGVYNRQNRQLAYASAGHPPAVLLSETAPGKFEAKRLKTLGMPIGMFADSEFVGERCQVNVSSTLYVFSDGVYEIRQPDHKTWNLDGFIDLLIECHQQTIDRPAHILERVRSRCRTDAFEDDCSLLQVKFR
jgi:sigma-B regulation protein RsbU (phosphoserine phosphatase)